MIWHKIMINQVNLAVKTLRHRKRCKRLTVGFNNSFVTGGTRQWGGSNCWNNDWIGYFRLTVDAIGMLKLRFKITLKLKSLTWISGRWKPSRLVSSWSSGLLAASFRRWVIILHSVVVIRIIHKWNLQFMGDVKAHLGKKVANIYTAAIFTKFIA